MTDMHDDPLDNLFNGGAPAQQPATRSPVTPPASYKPEQHWDGCPKCRGTGQTRWGVCYRCKGKGGKAFTQPAAVRAKHREQRQGRQQDKAVAAFETFQAEHPAEYAWMLAEAGRGFKFAASLLVKLNKYHSLTDGQLGAIRKCLARDAARTVERQAAAGAQAARATTVNVEKIEAAFAHARTVAHEENGDRVKWLRLYLGGFTFLDMPAKGQWKAAIKVTAREGDTYLGRIEAGVLTPRRECTAAQQAEIVTIAADPFSAAQAFGQRFKYCCACGRELTNQASRDLGMGPWCAKKYGWGA